MENTQTLPESVKRKKAFGRVACEILTYLVLILMLAFVLIPFYTVLISSFKNLPDILQPQFTWWPKGGKFYFEGYKAIFSSENYGGVGGATLLRSFWNTIWMNFPPLIVGLFVSAAAGFAFAKLSFPCKGFLFQFLIVTMMIPGCVSLVSTYLMYDVMHWTDTALPLLVPGLFGAVGSVFFMRQYMQGIPNELVEAAKIDGMGNIGIFFKIIVPLSVPVFVSLGLLNFISRYNDYLGPLLYLSNPELYTLQLALRNLSSMYRVEGLWDVILAACVVSIAPLVIIYIFTQKYFIKGISMSSGLKG